MKTRKIILMFAAFLMAVPAGAQKIAIKNNVLYDATTSINLALEFKIGDRTTLLVPASFNPWTFSDNKKLKHVLVQPEFRWWICEPFSGHFFGAHAHWADFNVGGFGPFQNTKDHRFEGWLVGAGVSYGYSWILHPRWSLEATVGVGYAYLDYDKFPYEKCTDIIKSDTKHYFGPTKAGITLIFLIK